MRLVSSNSTIYTAFRRLNNLPTNSFKNYTGKYKWYTDPIYVQPVVKPLQRGPDFSLLDGVSPRITHQYEWDRREEQTELAKQIVKCLAEVKEAERLNLERKQFEEQTNKKQEEWALSPKGNLDFA